MHKQAIEIFDCLFFMLFVLWLDKQTIWDFSSPYKKLFLNHHNLLNKDFNTYLQMLLLGVMLNYRTTPNTCLWLPIWPLTTLLLLTGVSFARYVQGYDLLHTCLSIINKWYICLYLKCCVKKIIHRHTCAYAHTPHTQNMTTSNHLTKNSKIMNYTFYIHFCQ